MIIGVGTELKRLLQLLWIQPCAKCDGRAIIMDEEGPQWCRDNADLIVSWMQEEAEQRGLPFSSLGARLLLTQAIRSADKKLKMLEAKS